jgi:hypothetical protein
MDLSSPRLKKILVGVAIFVVVIFIVIRFFRRSNYIYPNSSEETLSFSITTTPTFTPNNGSTPSLVTFTTTAPHGFSAGDLVYISGVTNIIYTEPVTGYPAGSGTPAAGGSAVYIYGIGSGANPLTFTVKATTAGSPVTSVTITSGGIGAGYTTEPIVTFSDPPAGGTRATGTAVIGAFNTPAAGKITGVTIPAGSGGSGYISAPTITFSNPPTGTAPTTGATAVLGTATAVTLSSATVKSIVQPSMDKMKNTDMLTCQTQYATDLISAPSTLTGMSPQTIVGTSAGNKVVTVTSTTGFAPGDKVLIPGVVVDSAGKAAVLVVATVSPSSSPPSLTFTQESVPSSPNTILPQTAVSNITTAYAARTACVQTSVTSYTVGHCRYLPQAGTNRPIVPLENDDPVAYAAYKDYQVAIAAITQAYTAPMSRVTQNSSFPVTTSGTVLGTALTQVQQQAIVEAARKADLANATQKYLASVCPGFYGQTIGTTNTDPSSEYKAWSVDTGASAPTTATPTAKKFWAGGVTDASIMTWAQNAGIVTLSGPVISVTIPSGGIGSGYTTAPPTVTFSDPPAGGTRATGTATIANGKITGVTIAAGGGGSGYTTNPTITFGAVTGATAPTATELGNIVVQISTSLSATAPLIPAATTGFIPPGGGAAVTYNSAKYGYGSGDNVNWRVAYKNGPGTYPKQTYAAS